MNCEHPRLFLPERVGIQRQGRDYCSEHCADAVPASAQSCGCGHAGWASEELRSLEEEREPRGTATGSVTGGGVFFKTP